MIYNVGSSTQNQRIECLWRDVFRCVTAMFYYIFHGLVQRGILHYVFLPWINVALNKSMGVYSNHRLFTECSWMPNQT